MSIGNTIEKAKPYVGGALGGIAVAAVVGFSADWIYAAGTVETKVHNARVDALSEICETNAEQYWTKKKDMKLAKLEGWDNDKREKLADKFAPSLPKDAGYHSDVVSACDDALKPA
jgi:hypothetical protein